jgi:hypothetical protein
MGDDRDAFIPLGTDFLNLVRDHEDKCEISTRQRISELGDKAPKCLTSLGTVLSLLNRASSCFWGCRGGDHVIEYFAGRVASSSRATLRLLHFAFYDEALSLVRSIGETANLLLLFAKDDGSFEKWQNATKKDRDKTFRPVHVRERLEELKIPLMIDQDRYSRLCELAVHVTPSIRPQGYNILQIPTSGGYQQDEGILLVLNELGIAMSHATVPLPKLLGYDNIRRQEFMNASADLLCNIGGIDIKGLDEYRARVLNDLRSPSSGDEPASEPI